MEKMIESSWISPIATSVLSLPTILISEHWPSMKGNHIMASCICASEI